MKIDFDLNEALRESSEPTPVVVVRITTSYWYDGNGLYSKKTIRFQRRKCSGGFNLLHEDCQMIGADEVIPRITNLNECEDGLYIVKTCNESSDWETPHIIDDYDYILIPYEEKPIDNPSKSATVS